MNESWEILKYVIYIFVVFLGYIKICFFFFFWALINVSKSLWELNFEFYVFVFGFDRRLGLESGPII